MAGQEPGAGVQATERNALAIGEQVVELRAVGVEAGLHVEDVFEHALHQGDVVADASFAAGDHKHLEIKGLVKFINQGGPDVKTRYKGRKVAMPCSISIT